MSYHPEISAVSTLSVWAGQMKGGENRRQKSIFFLFKEVAGCPTEVRVGSNYRNDLGVPALMKRSIPMTFVDTFDSSGFRAFLRLPGEIRNYIGHALEINSNTIEGNEQLFPDCPSKRSVRTFSLTKREIHGLVHIEGMGR